MSWRDCGVIFKVDHLASWAISHCYVPTALELDDRIRVYAAFWNEEKYGRLGYVDVDKDEPTKILGFSEKPILEDAPTGCFDCDGVTPLSVVKVRDEIRLYYAGWQKFDRADKRYTIFTGLCMSDAPGDTFRRHSERPVIGPRHDAETVRTGGFTTYMDGEWRTWIATYERTVLIGEKRTPAYNLETMRSKNGCIWPNKQEVIFPVREGEVLGYGRSAVWKEDDVYHGLFSVRAWDGKYYAIRHATSSDGEVWGDLMLDDVSFCASQTCDGQSEVCFPSLIRQSGRMLMFYNGNDFGRDGLRLAIYDNG